MKSRLKDAIGRVGKTQQELARALGVGRMTVYRWTTDVGVTSMTLRQAGRVAKELGCRIDDLYEE